jgi:hypothetical protein
MGGEIVWRLRGFGENPVNVSESIALCLLDWPSDDEQSRNLSVDRRAGRLGGEFRTFLRSIQV